MMNVLDTLPAAICYLIAKIVLFPFYILWSMLKALWEDVSELVGDLWHDWYYK